MASNTKRLRSGYTTGACAAAAAKAATIALLKGGGDGVRDVDIPFPDGSRHSFTIISETYNDIDGSASASVIKDAGDDPDVTNGAEIRAEARIMSAEGREGGGGSGPVLIKGGPGVGIVTKPGLSVATGLPAINPVPMKMIRAAVLEAIDMHKLPESSLLEITISVPNGEEISRQTLNSRLGIIGGISILGTTGIVRPLSSEAWTSSIDAAMDVAKATGCDEVVLSAGRVSEKAHMDKYRLPVESYIMMGDYVEFSLKSSKSHGFNKIHISSHWAKMLKISMAIPQTHVRHGAIDLGQAVDHLNGLGISVPGDIDFNTARQIYDYILSRQVPFLPDLKTVCRSARDYALGISGGTPVVTHLVSYEGEIIADSE